MDFCEQNIFDLIANINSSEGDELEKRKKISFYWLILVKNPGLARLLTREAFSIEETSLDERIGQMMAKVELLIKQNLQRHEQTSKLNWLYQLLRQLICCLPVQKDSSSNLLGPAFKTHLQKGLIDQFDFLIRSLAN